MSKNRKSTINVPPRYLRLAIGHRLTVVLIALLSVQLMTALVIWKHRQGGYDPARGLAGECPVERPAEFKRPTVSDPRCPSSDTSYKV